MASLMLSESPTRTLTSKSFRLASKRSGGINADAAGVGLENSPLRLASAGPLSLAIPALSPSNAPLDRALDHGRTKKGGVFSPLSKRKLEMFQAKQSRLQRFVKNSSIYEMVSAAFIVLNMVFIVLETDVRAQLVSSSAHADYDDSDGKMYSFVAGNIFAAVFVLDLVLRIHSERCQFFFGREKGWNMFDIVVVMTSVVEVIVHWYEIFTGATSSARAFLRKFSMLRMIRLLRVISHTRCVRVIRWIRELRLMVFSLTGTLKSLAWAMVLLVIILMVFGVFFTDGAITYLLQNPTVDSTAKSDLENHFGTLSKASVSLFMAMSGGEDWGNILHALKPLPYEYHVAFLVFVSFAILALLNVVTAVFVESAMQVSQNDKELVVMLEMESKAEFLAMMHQVFQELDTNESGALSLQEFEKHIEDEKLTAFLSSFDLDVSQVKTLFTLLDVDRTGEVDLEEFVSGCLRLKGGAKSLDMAILKYQVEWIMHSLQSLEHQSEEVMQTCPLKTESSISMA